MKRCLARYYERLLEHYKTIIILFSLGVILLGASLFIASHTAAAFHPLTIASVLLAIVCFKLVLYILCDPMDKPAPVYKLQPLPLASHSRAS